MESKTLNLLEAMQLAQIVSKYFDTESIKGMTGTDFAYSLFASMEVDEISHITFIFLGNIGENDPHETMISCVEGMIKNNLLDLLTAYKQIGFGVKYGN